MQSICISCDYPIYATFITVAAPILVSFRSRGTRPVDLIVGPMKFNEKFGSIDLLMDSSSRLRRFAYERCN